MTLYKTLTNLGLYQTAKLLGDQIEARHETPSEWVGTGYRPSVQTRTCHTLQIEDIGNLGNLPEDIQSQHPNLGGQLVCAWTLKEAKAVAKASGLYQSHVVKVEAPYGQHYYFPAHATMGYYRFLRWDGEMTDAIPW